MKKKLLLLFVVFSILSMSLSAAKFNSTEAIKMVTTEHFDIIYNDESSLLASQINDMCETTYTEICNFYDIKEGKRFPVIVSADIENFNSYFLSANPESIVIFDTVCPNDFFNIFGSQTMANVFRHELTHALTLSKVDSITYKLFGFDFASFNTTTFQKEGVTVYFESNKGEGRLNDPLEKSKLIEAKAEGTFPNYQSANVGRILHTNGSYYLFSSTFYEFLIDTYGIDMFNKYYNKITSFNLLFLIPEFAFNQTFPDSLMSVWDNYKSSVADIDVDDYLIIQDISDIPHLSLIDSGDNIYALNPMFGNLSKVSLNNGEMDRIMDIPSSSKDVNINDGVVTISSINMPSNFTNPNRTYTSVFKDGKNKNFDISSFRNSIYLDGNLVGIKNEGEIEYLQWIDMNGNIIKNFYLPKNEAIQRLSVDDDDNIVFTSRYLDNCYISRLAEEGRDVVKLDTGVSIQGLSIHNNNIVLSTVKKDELTKLTIVDFDSKTIMVMQETILGGVYYPILIDDDTMFFVRAYYGGQSLSRMDINQLTFNTQEIEVTHFDSLDKVEDLVVTIDGAVDYDGSGYLLKNIKPTLNYLVLEELFVENSLTVNLIGVDPISMYSVESAITGEYSDDEKAVISKNTFTYNMNDSKYYAKLDGKINWDNNLNYSSGFEAQLGWSSQTKLNMNKTLTYALDFDFNFSNGNYYTTYFQAQANYANLNKDYSKPFINSNANKIGTKASSNWSYYIHRGRNRLNYLSFNVGLSTYYYYYFDDFYYFDNSSDSYKLTTDSNQALSINGNLIIHLPYLISGIDDMVVTYDLPTTIQTYTKYNVFDDNILYLVDVSTTLFAYNLDGTIFNHIPLYYRTLNLEVGYNISGFVAFGPNNVGSMFRNPDSFIYAKAYLLVSPTSTIYSSSLGAKIGAKLRYDINVEKPWKLELLFESKLL
jgi:hypothetical protein